MCDHLLESSCRKYSREWSNIAYGEEITQFELIEVNCMHLIWTSVYPTQNTTPVKSFCDDIKFVNCYIISSLNPMCRIH